MKPRCRILLASLLLVVGALAAVNAPVSAGGPSKLDPPVLSCLSATPSSITLHVCAGATGAPGGVSIQWKKYSEWLVDGWDPTGSYCGLSLSGTCPTSNWDLGPSGCRDLTIHGTTVIDENAGACGASSDCISDLECDTDYIFRAFAHNVPGGLNKSDFSTDVICRTAPCTPPGECTFTWGYWKTHGPAGCNPSGGTNVWPAGNQTVGCLSLTQDELCAILQDNPRACGKGGGANAVLILEHQLIAAELNRANGAVVCAFADNAIVAANALLCGNEYACVGAPSALGQQMLAVKDVLAAYNDDQCTCPVDLRPQALPGRVAGEKLSSWGELKVIYR